jgi:desulfoferrodoxin (superoxide reductase-like protein)
MNVPRDAIYHLKSGQQNKGDSMKVIMIVFVLFMVPLLAHPPQSLKLEFDTETSVLSVTVNHNVNDATRHYIKQVEVELNGQKIIEQSFKKQVNNEEQQVCYRIIDAKQGDRISVEAYCSISGKKKAQLVVTDEKTDAGDQ